MIKNFKSFESMDSLELIKDIFQELEEEYNVIVSVFHIQQLEYLIHVNNFPIDINECMEIVDTFNKLISKCESMLDLTIGSRGNPMYGTGGIFASLSHKDKHGGKIYMGTSDTDKLKKFSDFKIRYLRAHLE
jgi:hypothetical protein